jgi:homoserine kinase
MGGSPEGPRPSHRSEARGGAPDEAGAGRVTVRVPATSANLGPAFDCAGLALAHHDVLEFSVEPSGLSVEVRGVGEGELPLDESHLVVRAFRAACAELGWSPPGLRVVAENAIPQGRGMGSSAAAVVAGVMGAWALSPRAQSIDGDAVLRLATEMEGHPDNVAPCLLGGLVLSWTDGDQVGADSLAVHGDVLPVLLVPDATLSTEVARGLLPDLVPHADAAFNAGRSALLVHALTAEPALLLPATEDRLHQQQRRAAMPGSLALVDRLRDAGHPAVVSGAGPSVLALATGTDQVEAIRALAPEGWTVLPLGVDVSGARVSREVLQVSSR